MFDAQFSADALKEQFKANVPLHRVGLPEEIASAALFLASKESSYISGIDLPSTVAWCRSDSFLSAATRQTFCDQGISQRRKGMANRLSSSEISAVYEKISNWGRWAKRTSVGR